MKSNFTVTNILIGFLVIVMVALGLNYWFRPWWKQWEAKQAESQVIQPRQADSGAVQLKNALTVSLSDRRKLTQLLWVSVTAINDSATQSAIASGSAQTELSLDPETQHWLETEQPGFIQIAGRQTTVKSALTSLTNEQYVAFQKIMTKATADWVWQPLYTQWPAVTGATIIKGDDGVVLPTMARLCAGQEETEPEVAYAAAKLSKLKTALVVGPLVDLGTGGYQGGAVCNDLQKTTEAAARFIENFGAESVLPIVGHFPGLGNAAVDPKKQPTTISVTISDLKPFSQLFKKYLNLGVLVSPVRVAEKFDGKPCSQSAACLTSFSTEFTKVLVIADGVDSAGALGKTTSSSVSATLTLAESMQQSLLAGSDILILEKPHNWVEINQALDILESAISQNPQLKQAVERAWTKVMALRTGPPQAQ